MRIHSPHDRRLHIAALVIAACLALALQSQDAHSQNAGSFLTAPLKRIIPDIVTGGSAPKAETIAPPSAPNDPRPPIQHQDISLDVGRGRIVRLPSPAANIFVADPKVIEIRPASPTTLFAFGVGTGRTTVAALDDRGNPIAELDITINPDNSLAQQAQASLNRLLPHTKIRVEAQPHGLVATGTADSPAEAARALGALKGFAGDGQVVEDQIAVAGPMQVTLRVRIAEVSRSVTRNLGVNWQGFGQLGLVGAFGAAFSFAGGSATCLPTVACSGVGVGLSGVIDALAQDNLARVLAEPNLTVMTGQSASFLAGGEFPIPVGQQNGTVTIEFKKYGVNLTFTPTVISEGRINLKVSPEVSQLTTQGAVTLAAGNSSIQVPALTVRRADTMVELGSGQGFAIAGLLQDSVTQTDSGLPGLGDLPVLGALFRSDAFIHNQTELVIIVTPYFSRPVDNPETLQIAGADYRPPSDLERILQLRQIGAATPAAAPAHLPGQAGFILQ